MDQNQFYLPLNLPDIREEILPEYMEELLRSRGEENKELFLGFTEKTIPSLVTQLFHQLGLTPCTWKINLFTSAPLEKQTIHLDGDPAYPEKFRPFAINWVWGGRTVMEWYTLKTNTLPDPIEWQEFRYITFDGVDNLLLAQKATLTGPTLVNIAYPHRVINASKERRFCFSACSEEVLTWAEITDLCYKHGLVRE